MAVPLHRVDGSGTGSAEQPLGSRCGTLFPSVGSDAGNDQPWLQESTFCLKLSPKGHFNNILSSNLHYPWCRFL